MNRAMLALLIGALSSGLNPLIFRFAEVDPAAAAFWRTAGMLPLLLLWRPTADDRQPIAPRDRWLLWAGGAAYGADIAVWYWAVDLTSVANAQLLAYTYPLWAALAAWALLGQRLAGRGWLAVGLGFGGSALVIGGRSGGLQGIGGSVALGDALGLAAALFYTVTILVQGGVRGRVGTRRVLRETTIAAALVLLPLGLFGERPFLPPDAAQGALMVALAVVTFAGQALVVYALGRLPVATAAVTGGLSVAFAAAGGWLLFAEPLGALQGLGFAVVLAAIMLSERKAPPSGRAITPACAPRLASDAAS